VTVSLESHRHVHFVGIGGIGMSALAKILLARGMTVSGSDQSAGPQTEALQALGSRIQIGHHAGAIEGADLVIITPAADGAPDVAAAREAGIPIIRRAQLLGAIANPGRGIAVAGTHGKSTTSSLIAHILIEAGLDPTVVVGAIAANIGSNARLGTSPYVVVEADEFDAAFLELTPDVAVITSAEPEHLDYFGTADRMYEAFAQFAHQVRETLIICADDAPLDMITSGAECKVLTYGVESGEWRAWDIEEDNGTTFFRAGTGGTQREYSMALAGEHNVRNALAALVTSHELGIGADTVASALSHFAGIGRRFELVGDSDGVLVMDDYGHHPTEIRKTLAAMRRRFDRPILVIFQPHTYSRTRAFLSDFACAFEDASRVYVLDIYGGRERETLGISAVDLVRAASERHPDVVYTGTHEATLERVLQDVEPEDLVVTMGAGDVDRLGPAIVARIRERSACGTSGGAE
jgi:UDP-N-acetylmuramate--alanine ligase